MSKLKRKEGETLLEMCTGPGLGMEEALLYKVCLSVFVCRVCVWAFGCHACLVNPTSTSLFGLVCVGGVVCLGVWV